MYDFDLVVARDLDQLMGILAANPNARLVAGATDFIPFVRAGKWQPRLAIDITGINELRFCRLVNGWIELGPLVTHAEMAASPLLRSHAAALAEAAASVADPSIRGRATLGGNICTASPAADTVPALLVLDTELVLANAYGTRRLALVDFLKGPGRTSLASGEALVAVRFPLPGAGTRFLKLGRRQAMAISVVNAAALVRTADGTVLEGRLALGAVAPTVVRCRPAERCLVNAPVQNPILAAAAFAAAAHRVTETISPIDDVRASGRYRQVVAVELARRALAEAWAQAGSIA